METYEEIYQRMCERYRQESGAPFDEASDIAIRLRVLAGELYNMQTSMEWLKRQLFPSKATGEFLDRFAQQRGLVRRSASKATGKLRFSVNEVKLSPVVIPAGTVVSTSGEHPVRIYTTEDSEIPPLTYSVLVAAEAEKAGYSPEIAKTGKPSTKYSSSVASCVSSLESVIIIFAPIFKYPSRD